MMKALIGAIAASAMLMTGFAATEAFAQAKPVLKPIKLRTEWVHSGLYAPFYFAQQRGYYAKEGLTVEVLPGQGSNATMDGILRGDLDFGFVSCWGLAVGVSKGRDVVSISTYTGQNGFGFFFSKDANVKSLKDLSGKNIVVSPASFDTQLFPSVLESVGLPGDMMRRLNVDPAQKVPTYARGQADVVVSHVPYASPIIQAQRPSDYILWSSVGFTLPDYCLTTSRKKLQEDPKLVEAFLRASYAAIADAVKKPEDAAAATLELNPVLEKDKTLDQWKLTSTILFSEDSKSCPLGWHSQNDWNKGLKTLQQFGGLEGSIDDHSKFYTNQFFPCSR
jgi:NitT/TauT family transport system substrate-binding protein